MASADVESRAHMLPLLPVPLELVCARGEPLVARSLRAVDAAVLEASAEGGRGRLAAHRDRALRRIGAQARAARRVRGRRRWAAV